MSELRKKQKQKRESAIISAALKLVSSKGYRNTSIEEIAHAAEVGPATVYNYFNSKSALFLSVINEQVEKLIAAGRTVLDNPPPEPEAALTALLESYLAILKQPYDKQLFRELMVVFFVEQLSVRRQLMGMDYLMLGQVTRLIALLQERGQIKPALDPQEIAMMFYMLIGGGLIAFMVDDDSSLEDYLVAIKSHIHLLFSGVGV